MYVLALDGGTSQKQKEFIMFSELPPPKDYDFEWVRVESEVLD
jgi:hypothetical protein